MEKGTCEWCEEVKDVRPEPSGALACDGCRARDKMISLGRTLGMTNEQIVQAFFYADEWATKDEALDIWDAFTSWQIRLMLLIRDGKDAPTLAEVQATMETFADEARKEDSHDGKRQRFLDWRREGK